VFQAYYDARAHKRKTLNQLRFEMNLEENLVALYRENASYQTPEWYTAVGWDRQSGKGFLEWFNNNKYERSRQ